MNETEQQNQNQQNNSSMNTNIGYGHPSFMMMRLDTTSLVDDFKNFLSRREDRIVYDKHGNPFQQTVQVGTPLANDEGIMELCNILKMRINHHVVQGNLKDDHYWDYIKRAREDICETIVKRCEDWDIKDDNLNMIIDELCALIEIYITRPIDNLERTSYGQVIRQSESVVQQQQKGGLFGFASGIGKT
jgi:hypothetical protein